MTDLPHAGSVEMPEALEEVMLQHLPSVHFEVQLYLQWHLPSGTRAPQLRGSVLQHGNNVVAKGITRVAQQLPFVLDVVQSLHEELGIASNVGHGESHKDVVEELRVELHQGAVRLGSERATVGPSTQ